MTTADEFNRFPHAGAFDILGGCPALRCVTRAIDALVVLRQACSPVAGGAYLPLIRGQLMD